MMSPIKWGYFTRHSHARMLRIASISNRIKFFVVINFVHALKLFNRIGFIKQQKRTHTQKKTRIRQVPTTQRRFVVCNARENERLSAAR